LTNSNVHIEERRREIVPKILSFFTYKIIVKEERRNLGIKAYLIKNKRKKKKI